MKMPTTILYIILTAVILTSSNVFIQNQLALKLSLISPGFTSTAIPPGLVDAPSTYFDDSGVLV